MIGAKGEIIETISVRDLKVSYMTSSASCFDATVEHVELGVYHVWLATSELEPNDVILAQARGRAPDGHQRMQGIERTIDRRIRVRIADIDMRSWPAASGHRRAMPVDDDFDLTLLRAIVT
ncbi:hypothetical protein LCGC14_1123580 [marine sediment metagenome]|uniref:Uncharacterized protein n=1 Tax=marine sediment metagenome TaxID=412755 RepID=A0A0F9PLH5_9ZZZZ